jgi:adenylate cyclase
MAEPAAPIERKLAAIFAADVAGYSRLMGQDEAGTMRALTAHREVMDRLIAEHRGRIANTAGDSVLAEFPSVVDAVECAVEVQDELRGKNVAVPGDRQLRFRIGVHVGDLMVRGGDLLGDAVNVAARLQALADPGGICISGDAHQYARSALALTFTDLGEQAIKNVAKGVRAYAVRGGDAGAVAGDHSDKPLSLPDKPTIAVLPFTNMSGDPEQEYFADGLVEDIITALSRFNALFVIARNSSFTYKGRAVDVRQVGRELGVRYVLEGSVRKAGGRVRITGQLIEAETGRYVWAERFDGELADIFDLQDRITESVVGAIEPSLRVAEIVRSKAKPTDSLAAYDLYLRALPHHYNETEESVKEALRLLRSAVQIDPQFGLAYAFSATCHAQRIYNNQTSDPAAEAEIGTRCARTALETSGNDPEVLWRCAHALAHFQAEAHECVSLAERAVALNPNSAPALCQSAWAQIFIGNYRLAAERFERAIGLSPLDPSRFAFTGGLGMAYLMMEDYRRAVALGRETYSLNPNYLSGLRMLASSLAQLGLQQEASEVVHRIRRLNPDVRIGNLTPAIVRSPNSRVYLEGLRKAGLPE